MATIKGIKTDSSHSIIFDFPLSYIYNSQFASSFEHLSQNKLSTSVKNSSGVLLSDTCRTTGRGLDSGTSMDLISGWMVPQWEAMDSTTGTQVNHHTHSLVFVWKFSNYIGHNFKRTI